MNRRVQVGVGVVLASALSVATISPAINIVYAEEANVNLVVVNNPAEVTSSSSDNGKTLEEGSSASPITIEYKNSKKITVTIVGPDGSVLSEEEIEVDFSPNKQTLTYNFPDVLKDLGTYTIKITATGTDGEVVSATDLSFEYGSVPTVPDTGTYTIFGAEFSKNDSIIVLTVLAVILVAGIAVALKKGAKNENA